MKIKFIFLMSMVSCAIQASGGRDFNSSPVSSVGVVDEERIIAKIQRLNRQNEVLALELNQQGIKDYPVVSVKSLAAGDKKAAWQQKSIEREYCLMELQTTSLRTPLQENLWRTVQQHNNLILCYQNSLAPLYERYEGLNDDNDDLDLVEELEEMKNNKAREIFMVWDYIQALKATLRGQALNKTLSHHPR